MSPYTISWPAFTIAMSRPAAIAWYRNAEWIARRTGSLPRKQNDRFDTPPDTCDARAAPLDLARRLDERLREVVVLLHAGGDREDVGIEDDVRRVVAGLLDEQPVRALADLDLALDRAGLALLVERHHDDGGAVALDPAGLSRKSASPSFRLIEFTTPLPWMHFRPASSTDHSRAVDHDRHPRDLGLGGDQVEERGHGLLGVEQVGVHVHVEEVRAALHLVERDLDGRLVVARLDQAAELRRAGDVLPLADHHEPRVGRDPERLEAAKRGEAIVGGSGT